MKKRIILISFLMFSPITAQKNISKDEILNLVQENKNNLSVDDFITMTQSFLKSIEADYIKNAIAEAKTDKDTELKTRIEAAKHMNPTASEEQIIKDTAKTMFNTLTLLAPMSSERKKEIKKWSIDGIVKKALNEKYPILSPMINLSKYYDQYKTSVVKWINQKSNTTQKR